MTRQIESGIWKSEIFWEKSAITFFLCMYPK